MNDSQLSYLPEAPDEVEPSTPNDLSSSVRDNVRLRLLQAEEHLRLGQLSKVQEYLLTARLLLERKQIRLPVTRGGLTGHQKHRLQLYIEQNLNRIIPSLELASLVDLSYSHFCRAFKQAMGTSPRAYIRARRLERSKELLLKGNLPLSVIAQECGLSDQAALCKLFRRVAGTTPTTWRRGHSAYV
jgi:AraC family transcriptional regulator